MKQKNETIERTCPFCGQKISGDTYSGVDAIMLGHSDACREKFFRKEEEKP